MGPIRIVLLVLIIGVSSVITDFRWSMSFTQDEIGQVPLLKSALLEDALPTSLERHKKDSHFIAQDFVPIVIIAFERDVEHDFAFYLSLHNQKRQKEYFLLI